MTLRLGAELIDFVELVDVQRIPVRRIRLHLGEIELDRAGGVIRVRRWNKARREQHDPYEKHGGSGERDKAARDRWLRSSVEPRNQSVERRDQK